jgi:anti-sigma B factor antagonist/stage II sporulation protein AA (anti-sigma F factor antagonist)
VRRFRDRIVLHLAGELELATAAILYAEIGAALDEGPAQIVLDPAQLEFIDSFGLRAILQVQQACRERGCELLLRRGREQVQRLFDAAGLDAHRAFLD